jgi:hypothetical protein
VLLPRFAAAGGAHTAVVGRVLIEHAEIRLRVLRLHGGTASAAVLEELGGLLAEHVQLEEHELFPAFEESLEDRQLRRLAADVAAAERKARSGPAQPDQLAGEDAGASGLLAPYDVPFVVEIKGDRRNVEVGTDPFSNPVLLPVLVLATWGVEPEDDQIGIKLK